MAGATKTVQVGYVTREVPADGTQPVRWVFGLQTPDGTGVGNEQSFDTPVAQVTFQAIPAGTYEAWGWQRDAGGTGVGDKVTSAQFTVVAAPVTVTVSFVGTLTIQQGA